jgi:hypothetical protein
LLKILIINKINRIFISVFLLQSYHSDIPTYDSAGYDPVPETDNRDPMSKFFGLTGTTSHDIQVLFRVVLFGRM